jgi:hypothetical protein
VGGVKKIDKDFESLKLLKDWSIWMIGVETAILGFLGVMKHTGWEMNSFLFALTLCVFGGSILCAAWVLSSIPSVTRRLDERLEYSRYKLYDYNWLPAWITLDRVAIAQHVLFGVGIILFVVLIIIAF